MPRRSWPEFFDNSHTNSHPRLACKAVQGATASGTWLNDSARWLRAPRNSLQPPRRLECPSATPAASPYISRLRRRVAPAAKCVKRSNFIKFYAICPAFLRQIRSHAGHHSQNKSEMLTANRNGRSWRFLAAAPSGPIRTALVITRCAYLFVQNGGAIFFDMKWNGIAGNGPSLVNSATEPYEELIRSGFQCKPNFG